MSRQCQVTGKKPAKGRTYNTRGIAKKKKGMGLTSQASLSAAFYLTLLKRDFG